MWRSMPDMRKEPWLEYGAGWEFILAMDRAASVDKRVEVTILQSQDCEAQEPSFTFTAVPSS